MEVDASGATVYYAETELTADNYDTAGSTKAITRADAGTTTVYYYVEGRNYDAVSGSKTIEIAKADITPAVCLDGWTYGETAKTPSVTGNTGNGAVIYTYAAKGSSDFTAAVPTTADVTLYAKWTPTDYQLTSITGTTADISNTWTKGSNVDVVITVKLNAEPDVSFAHFTGVEIDGKALVGDIDYTAKRAAPS